MAFKINSDYLNINFLKKQVAVILLICLGFPFLTFSQNELKYTVKFVRGNDPQLMVSIEFVGSADGCTFLEYPNKTWGQSNLFNCIKTIYALQKDIRIESRPDSNFFKIFHKAGRRIKLLYILKQDFSDSVSPANHARPIIQNSYFHVYGSRLFVFPSHYAAQENNMHITWKDFPKNWALVNSFSNVKRSTQKIKSKGKEWLASIWLGGDFRIYKFEVKAKPVFFAVRGSWNKVTDNQFIDVIRRSFMTQREFWKDFSQSYYLVSLLPVWVKWDSSKKTANAGHGLTNSFSTISSNNAGFELEDLIELYNHELLHNWIGNAIITEKEHQSYWFSEGFTDYYTYKNMVVGGLLKADKFVRKLNQVAKELYLSPVRNVPGDSMTYDKFWSNQELEKLPYRRGMLFAFFLDNRIRKRSKEIFSLDDAMRDILKHSLETGSKLTDKKFIEIIAKYVGEEIDFLFNAYIKNGELIKWSTENLVGQIGIDNSSSYPVFSLKGNLKLF